MQTCLYQCRCDWLRLSVPVCSQTSCLVLADELQSISTEDAVTECWVIFR